MSWKKEKWHSEVFPGLTSVFNAYKDLSARELAIVAASVLDLALAELLASRLLDIAEEAEDFLGLDEDGRSPGATFGARIQLAVLTGVIDKKDVSILRIIKNIRNQFAHRVVVDF